jgi:phosphoglycerol transferase MdoB-like AlkP superfamily enzyme
MVAGVEGKYSLLVQALLKGLQFDNLIASYISFLPLILLSIPALCNKIPRKIVLVTNVWFIILYATGIIVFVADIPYFTYFFTHLGIAAFGWFEFGGTTAELLLQSEYYPFIALMAATVALFVFFVLRFGKYLLKTSYTDLKKADYRYYIPLTIIIYGLCFLGIRGSLQRYPLQTGYAYFSNNSFFNQLGINPCFSLIKALESAKQYNNVNGQMSLDEAFASVYSELKINSPQNNHCIVRETQPEGKTIKPNIVIILLESMGTKYLELEYNGSKLTPYLHELIDKSYYFENFYSAGVHTNNGIVSTLYGFPCLFDKPSMKNELHYTGLPGNLRKLGYQNLFFITGNPNYDHMNLFLMESGFDRIYSQYDYPSEKIANNFGVQDDYLLEYGLERLNEAAHKDKPFLGVFLTVSNHGPYIVPPKYENSADTDDRKIVRFVDDALKNFMENASQQAWFDNTIFILLGDHGAMPDNPKYDMPVEYNHIPLIMYSRLFEDAPKRFDCLCGQIDVFPTLLGIMNAPYTNNSLGIDVFKEQRPYMFFVNDNRLGCIDRNYFYVYNLSAKADILYDLHETTPENIIRKEPQTAQAMKSYSMSMMIVADDLIKNKQTR